MRDGLRNISLIAVIAISCGLFGCIGGLGKVVDKWETTNQPFKIRVTVYQEKRSVVLPHYYSVFDSAVLGSNDWHKIVTVRTDENVPIPHEQIRFINDRTGYIFMGQHYAVTLDGGRNWSVWDAGNEYGRNAFIKEVQITPDGVGAMTIYLIHQQERELRELNTKDYGKHWNV